MPKVKLTIDGQEVEVEKDLNLIEAAKLSCNKIPHFCYHPGLEPDGNCRMCLVQIEKMPKPVIACKTGATEGMVVHTNSPEVLKMRRSVMEFLLINHPLDCPTCDQAGECRLQDYYMQHDLIPSRYEESKVHKSKMVDLGAGVMLDEERCVVCTRCVRFMSDVAKTGELSVQHRGNHSCVSTFPGKKLESPYSGNVVDLCPVGALTSKDFRYKKRVWFLSETNSICPGCSRGCNISIHHADNTVYRLKPRYNADVNGYWMCDYGRYDYKFTGENRRLKPAVRDGEKLKTCSYQEAADHLMSLIKKYEPYEIGFVASAQESCEEIDAFCSLAQDVFDTHYVYFSENKLENSFHDDFLITADKNPNKTHIQKKGLKNLTALSKDVKAVVVQRGLNQEDLKLLTQKGIQILLAFTTNQGPVENEAKVVLPIPTYAEQDGSFINLDSKVQKFTKAFEPRGESKTIQAYAQDFEKLFKK